MSRSGALSFYQADGLGSITSLTDTTGAVVGGYNTDAFGNSVTTSGNLVNPFRYTGREWDAETGLYYYRARYYDPASGRFLSEDPIGFKGGIGFYTYTRNDPTDLLDPSGLSPKRLPPNQTKTRVCNGAEQAQCSQTCAAQGKTAESCRVAQHWGIIRWKDGIQVEGWINGPMSCSCNEPPENNNKCETCQKVWDWVQERWSSSVTTCHILIINRYREALLSFPQYRRRSRRPSKEGRIHEKSDT